jgi:ubiquinone biosynthesis monooxygenase Coq7
LQDLPAADVRSRRVIEAMQADEVAHGAKATQIGGAPLPRVIASAMKMTSRLMTKGSFWL